MTQRLFLDAWVSRAFGPRAARRPRSLGRLVPLSGAMAFVALWQIAATRYAPEQLPGPLQIVPALAELCRSGALLRHLSVSLMRFGVAYGGAAVLGIPFGLWLGWRTYLFSALGPVIQILRPISPIAWFPLAVLWFGIGNPPAIFIIFLSAFFPILLSTINAVRSVSPLHLKVASNFGVPSLMLFRCFVVPASFPVIMNGLRIAVGAAWIHLVAGEMLGAQSGLGFLILDARNFLRTDLLVAGMLVVGLLGLAIDRVMNWAERCILVRWGDA